MINISEELVEISASAFLNMVLHIFRFWSSEPTGIKKISYGLLLGTIEDNTRHIKKIVPIHHADKPDLTMDENYIKKTAGPVNAREMEVGSASEVIGWYRSSNRDIKFAALDIKNHIAFQEFNPKFISLIFAPQIYLDPEQFGFSVFRLKGDKYYNMMTDYYKIPFELQTIEDAQEIIGDFKGYINNYFLDKPLITEFNEK